MPIKLFSSLKEIRTRKKLCFLAWICVLNVLKFLRFGILGLNTKIKYKIYKSKPNRNQNIQY